MDRYPTREPKDVVDQLRKGWSNVPAVLEKMGFPSLRDGQKPVVASILAGRDTFCVLPTSGGKCFGAGTGIMLHDGSVKAVESLVPGDVLMGPDGTPRVVKTICRGRDRLYRVRQRHGKDYIVNSEHILSLKLTNMSPGERSRCGDRMFSSGDLANVSLKDYLASSKTFKHVAKGHKSTGVTFSVDIPLDPDMPPYVLGVWLGDGSISRYSITTPDEEIKDAVYDYAKSLGHFVRPYTSNCTTYSVSAGVVGGGKGHHINRATGALRRLGLLNAKYRFVPEAYKLGDKDTRMQVLAGILDTDGHKSKSNGYDFVSKHEQLAEDVVFIARSLGFRASSPTPRRKQCTNTGAWGDYWRVYIGGVTQDTPLRVARKKPDNPKPYRNSSIHSISVEPEGFGDYYGFELEEGPDRMFLLEDFTVAHNSACFVVPTLALEWKTIVFSPLVALMRDQVQSLQRKRISAMAVSSMQSESENSLALEKWARGDLSFLYVAPERLHNSRFKAAMDQQPPDMVVVDEVHTLSQWSENFRSAYCVVGDFIADKKPKVVSAFTATCTKEIDADVRRVLGIGKAPKIVSYPRRTNLKLESRDMESDSDIASVLKHEIHGPCIVYCSTVDRVEKTTETLGSLLGEEVIHFHGQLNDSDKRTNMDLFMSDRVRIVVATNAFGMGVDKPNVRGVIHRDLPGTMEALSQEVGRGGRDGEDSLCITFTSPESLKTQRFFIECSNPSPQEIRKVFKTLSNAADRSGYLEMTGSQIGMQSGVFKWKVNSIMEILKANGVIERTDDKKRAFRIRAKTPHPKDARFQHWWEIVDMIGIPMSDGFLEVDMPSFVQQTGVSDQTVRTWLRKWQEKEWIRYVPPFAGAPARIVGGLDKIDFGRLEGKLTEAYEKLALVIEYTETPDKDKHDFLEKYFLDSNS